MTNEEQTQAEIEEWKPIEEYIKQLLETWEAKGAYTGDEVKTLVGGNIRTFTAWLFKHQIGTVQELAQKLAEQQAKLEAAHKHSYEVGKQMTEFGLYQTYVREVSTFHRQALLPLLAIVKQITEAIGVSATDAMKKPLEEMMTFFKKVEDRAKHFEQQALVEKARQSAQNELARMTVKNVP